MTGQDLLTGDQAAGALAGARRAPAGPPPRKSVIVPAALGLTIGTIFVTIFLAAFHTPRPHDLPVGIVGPGQQVGAVAAGLRANAPGAVRLVPYASAEAATSAIGDRRVYGAYVIDGDAGAARLLYAGANGPAVQSTLIGIFQPVAAAGGLTLQPSDVLPTSAGDTRSLSIFYTGFGLVLAGYLFGLVSYQMAPRLRLRLRLLSLGAFGLLGGTVTTLIAGPTGFNALPANVAALGSVAILLATAVGAAAVMIMRLAGPVNSLVAATVLLILGNSTGGGTLPVEYLPDWLRPLSGVLPVGVGIRALQGVSYFADDGFVAGLVILAAWIAGSAAVLYLMDSPRPRAWLAAHRPGTPRRPGTARR